MTPVELTITLQADATGAYAALDTAWWALGRIALTALLLTMRYFLASLISTPRAQEQA